jgi:hypothetical protein
MRELVVGRGAVPVHLAGRDVDDVARADLIALTIRREDATSFDAVEHLRDLVRVKIRPGAGAEPHDYDLDTFGPCDYGLNTHVTDEELLAGGNGGFG